ncbi:rho guanine nucleotide exchange factor 39-like [Ruditapes philippinarum]|uniref:rho guanine nucleotide exchange factor 39-like n=1 Tax=Ruditapes philippinarum TaxID=129788 RepID=UPI00295BD413|nr:rho guanine nucleotide exchange factor 39-like [Ruditapes philippinarum]
MLTTRTRLKVLSEIAEEREDSFASDSNPGTPIHVVRADSVGNDEERREKRRKRITEELFETEKTYIHHLELAYKFFEFPLRFNCLISERAHSQLFSNLEQIKEVNTKLLEYMEQTTVGTAFKFLGPFLKLYSMYANNHQQAISTLQESLKDEKFAEFIRDQEDRPEVMGLKVGALLITPVQRIPRYKLLLEDLLENTNQEHHDYTMLKEAAKQVGEIARHINEHVRQNENFQKMLSIHNSFDNSAPKILAPGRVFIKEGKLNKISRRGKSQERMFFLFSDMIIYGKPKLLDSGNNSYSCCCVLPLRHCQVEKVLGTVQRSDGGGMFRINCKEESLLLYCNDPDEAQSWVEDIDSATRKLNVNRQTLRKPSSQNVPVRGKSLLKMRLRERKQDLKRKLNPKRKASKDERQPMKALVENCLTPPKRQRIDGHVDVEASCSKATFVEENEICLDDWNPEQAQYVNNDIDDKDENSQDDSSDNESDADFIDENAPVIVIENPPYREDNVNNGLCFDHESEFDADNVNENVNGRHRVKFSSDVVKGNSNSSQPWHNTKFQEKEEPSCSTLPIRRVVRRGAKVTSRIGGMMDSVRDHKSCTII